jgi:hypothetical protein
MRFATKFDRGIVWLLLPAAVFTGVVLPILRLLHIGAHPAPLPIALFPIPIWLFALAATLPQYYEVRGDGLFIRQGWRRVLVPYPSLAELKGGFDSRSAGVYSMDRVVIVTRENRRYIIAPADQQGFLDAVAQCTPHLERRGSGLAVPFASTTLA